MYNKLANSILTSTVWMESDTTRLVWLTLLAMSDKNGEVQASVPGLANVARVSVDKCREAIGVFLSPDPDSRTKDDEGRRLEEIDGGWFLINHPKYRDLASDDDRKQKAAIRQKRFRDRQAKKSNAPVTLESHQKPHTDTDTDTEKKKKDASAKRFIPPSVDDVKAYCEERGNKVDASSFIDHYAANGWMRGKSKIKDWKACVRTWETPKPNGTTVTASIWPEIVAHLGRIDPYKDYSEGIAAKFGDKALAAVKSIGVPNINQANEYQASVLAKRFGELMNADV